MLDWNSAPLADGLACYKNGQFFEAHEHWERSWLTLAMPEKSFLQCLIQVSAAFHHFHAGNKAGAASLLRRALGRLERYPALFGGIDVATLREGIKRWLQALESDTAALPQTYPRIRSTFESEE